MVQLSKLLLKPGSRWFIEQPRGRTEIFNTVGPVGELINSWLCSQLEEFRRISTDIWVKRNLSQYVGSRSSLQMLSNLADTFKFSWYACLLQFYSWNIVIKRYFCNILPIGFKGNLRSYGNRVESAKVGQYNFESLPLLRRDSSSRRCVVWAV
jgi:hypothetical protein